MEIKTKFNIGDKIFYTSVRGVESGNVTEIIVSISKNNCNVFYETLVESDIPENKAFRTREEMAKAIIEKTL